MKKRDNLTVRNKAVDSHSKTSVIFYDKYQIFERNPYENAFGYGRKKIFDFLFHEFLKVHKIVFYKYFFFS